MSRTGGIIITRIIRKLDKPRFEQVTGLPAKIDKKLSNQNLQFACPIVQDFACF